jgi:hypothetical protein
MAALKACCEIVIRARFAVRVKLNTEDFTEANFMDCAINYDHLWSSNVTNCHLNTRGWVRSFRFVTSLAHAFTCKPLIIVNHLFRDVSIPEVAYPQREPLWEFTDILQYVNISTC